MKNFSFQGNYKWIDILPSFISYYNNTKSRTIGMKRKVVNRTNEAEVMKSFRYKNIDVKKIKSLKLVTKFKLASLRIYLEKATLPILPLINIFTVVKFCKTNLIN